MRLNFSTSWIFRGWITCVLVTFYAQNAVSKSNPCDETHYFRGSKCCNRCGPGFRVFSHCTETQKTLCLKCPHGEYQSGWTNEMTCSRQKFCDTGKGFLDRSKIPDNPKAEEPCRCLDGLQCYSVNCEYCEEIPPCPAGSGREVDPESSNGRKICVKCEKGFFSAGNNADQCKPWTNCKAEGRRETQAGSATSDAVCGQPVSGAERSWVIVSVLSVIIVLCLLILLLFCYKDKLKLLSVNLRSCVQNLKRTRIQQETLAPLYHSGAGGGIGGPGGPKCSPCETTKLICQAPHGPADGPSCTFPTSTTDVKVSLPFTEEMPEKEGIKGMEDQSEGSGEPEEVSEEEVVSVSPLLAGSCVCVIPVCEPLEVGENEDCSQAVSPGTPGTCSCGGLDGEEGGKEDKSDSKRADKGGGRAAGNQEKIENETGAASLVSLSPPLLHTSSIISPSSPLAELCLPLSQAQVRPEFKYHLPDASPVKQEGLYRLASTGSTSTESSTTSTMSSVSPLMTSSSVGDLYLDKPPEGPSPGQGQGVSWGDSRENKLSTGESELECSPESLHSQLGEPTLTSGQVSGNHNTTFISSGQVMNFSGDVIVVYVSQTSHGSDCVGQDDAFGSPVQEEANETALFFQSSLRSQGDSISHSTLQDETLPVQEGVEERPLGK
ncbi:tumor necrosis factor receptor superfamily member 11A [Stegastes partitus]|uniref:Tumor necrosis factor receptor superfamily member 11A-like n=1 Tax=Stegastes partitus TaxID=144197 RepID=A0A3B5B209_9TELE|nr:PREDICTED: tumor necrosis factor receptor superfamily member 11A-like [Stegastes partitus]